MTSPILIMMAMEAEAAPVAAVLGLGSGDALHPSLPALVRTGATGSTRLILVTHGQDRRFGVDAIGTHPAAVTTWAAATRFSPGLIINAGTAGGFARHGAEIGDVYLSDGPVVFHDRRIPLAGFESYGLGSHPSMDTRGIAKKLNLKLGRLTTGDSLDLSEPDARAIQASGANVKDMEAASVAWVASLLSVPFLGVKAVTDLVDATHPTADQFLRNLDHAVARLASAMPGIIAAITPA